MASGAVPYRSQMGDPSWTEAIVERCADPCEDPSWVDYGFASPVDYRFWARRMCGLACLESILGHWGIAHPNRYGLLIDAIGYQVYQVRNDGSVYGLVYEPFQHWVATRFGISCEIVTHSDCAGFTRQLDIDALGMASVSPEIRHPNRKNIRKGGHLVLVTGQTESDVFFHNPSGFGANQANVCMQKERFETFFAGRGLILRR